MDNNDGGWTRVFNHNTNAGLFANDTEHDGIDGGNIWTQTSNPVTDLVSGYVAIRETYNGMHWGGLEKSSTSSTLIDGSTGSGWWFYAIGTNRHWPSAGTIPGPLRSNGITQVQLFIK